MAKSDADWADHFLKTLMACLNLSDAHQMVIQVSFRSNVEPEAFADELRERPEIALAIMQVPGGWLACKTWICGVLLSDTVIYY